MKLIYIAGPFRASNAWIVEQNVRHAENMAMYAAVCGLAPLCPHTNTRFFNGTCTDEFWLKAALEMLRRCDAVLLLSTWENSEGARAEAEYAKACGLRIFYETSPNLFKELWNYSQEAEA